MLIAIPRVKRNAHCYTRSEALLIAIHGVKLYAHCYTWSEALCALLYMEWIYME